MEMFRLRRLNLQQVDTYTWYTSILGDLKLSRVKYLEVGTYVRR